MFCPEAVPPLIQKVRAEQNEVSIAEWCKYRAWLLPVMVTLMLVLPVCA